MKKTVAGGNPCYRFSDTIMMEVVEAGKINCIISFVALLTGDSMILRKLYPEWDLQV